MTVYVDQLRTYKSGKWCHMIADTTDELHQMAKLLGLKREWFQSNGKTPHYDLRLSKKIKALQLGAVEITGRELVNILNKIKKEN